MLAIKLREAMKVYERRTGERLTYETLAERTGLSASTFQAISTRLNHNTTLRTIEKICRALETTPGELLELIPDSPRKSKKKKKTSRNKVSKKR